MTAARIRTQFPIAVSSHQPSAVSHKPSAISHQPSTIGHQPSAISQFRFPAISRQPSAIGRQPSANFGSQPSAVGHQPSAISHHVDRDGYSSVPNCRTPGFHQIHGHPSLSNLRAERGCIIMYVWLTTSLLALCFITRIT